MAAEAKAAVAVAVMAAEEAVAVVEVTEVRDQNEPAAGAGPVAATRCAAPGSGHKASVKLLDFYTP